MHILECPPFQVMAALFDPRRGGLQAPVDGVDVLRSPTYMVALAIPVPRNQNPEGRTPQKKSHRMRKNACTIARNVRT